MSNPYLRTALLYAEAGLSVVPLRLDGSKRPSIAWKEYQSRIATTSEIESWFASKQGIAAVTGAISGGLEVLDFDAWEVFAPWQHSIPQHLQGWLPAIETGGGGYQVYYRCHEVCGNSKIAMEEPRRRIVIDAEGNHRIEQYQDVRIETRGEGGYVVAPGSPLAVHRSGNPYVQVFGPPLPEIPTISKDDRRELWSVARRFDCRPDPMAEVILQRAKEIKRELFKHLQPSQEGETPWDWFDRQGNWRDILEPHGWTSADGVHWSRPNRDKPGFSATIRQADSGVEVLIVFSTSAGPLAAIGTTEHRTLGKFEAWKILNHGGNSKAATKAARELMKGVAV